MMTSGFKISQYACAVLLIVSSIALVAAMAKIESGIDLTQEQLLQGYEDATYC